MSGGVRSRQQCKPRLSRKAGRRFGSPSFQFVCRRLGFSSMRSLFAELSAIPRGGLPCICHLLTSVKTWRILTKTRLYETFREASERGARRRAKLRVADDTANRRVYRGLQSLALPTSFRGIGARPSGGNRPARVGSKIAPPPSSLSAGTAPPAEQASPGPDPSGCTERRLLASPW